MANWTNIFLMQQRGLELVARLNKANRKADFRRGKRLGKYDHIVSWRKPSSIRSLDRETYQSLPEFITIRECLIRVAQPGFRTKSIVIVTTLLDPLQTTSDDLGKLYRARWNVELDLRSLKDTLHMDVLRCKTPELVRKEIWTHILAYNLIRTIMAQAATQHKIEPRTISFKGTVQTLSAFQSLLLVPDQQNAAARKRIVGQLLDAIVSQRAGDRPDRFEPRLRKRRNKKYDLLMKPRHEAKRSMAKQVREN